VRLANEEETRALGAAIARAAGGQRVIVLLDGPLGAGKTSLARGLLEGLGHRGPVASPTYAIVHSYPEIGACHADVYRIEGAAELEQTGVLDDVERGSWVLEWAALFPDAWPVDHVQVTLAVDGDQRTAVLDATGERSRALLARLAST